MGGGSKYSQDSDGSLITHSLEQASLFPTILEKLSNEDHSNSDCILLVVLSHGDSEILYAEDTVYPRSKLWRYFTDEN